MGGTNPAEIRALMNAGVHVSQSDILHAKVYLFDNQVIIGSSNASANGLSLQGGETSGWIEANVFCDEAAFCQKASRWFAKLTTQIITEDDLKNAEEIWLRRRANIQVAIPKGGRGAYQIAKLDRSFVRHCIKMHTTSLSKAIRFV
jgi:phosphatidylserine/phosphatidylglycerophosphate/cardiolipin synthase-like enzyme